MQVSVTSPETLVGQIFSRQPGNQSVIIADGYGIKISVYRGILTIEDGLGRTRRIRKIPKVPREVSRLFILGDTGYVSLESIRWCADLGISITQLDRTGRIVMSSPWP
jgi:hypothetical protein